MIARRKPRVLVGAPIHDDALAILRTVAEVRVVHSQTWAEACKGDRIASVDAVVMSNGMNVPPALIERMVRLRVIGRTGDESDLEVDAAAHVHGVQVVQASRMNRAMADKYGSKAAEVAVCEQVVEILRRRYTIDSLPLQVVAVEQVVPHENFDSRRVADLADRLVADGRLVNPPIAIRQGRKYVILDGATRLTAFRHLGYPHIVVHEVDLERAGVTLHTWYHAVHGGSPAMLAQMLSTIPGLTLYSADGREVGDTTNLYFGEGSLGYFRAADGQTYCLKTEDEELEHQWLDVLNRTVAAYSEWGTVERTVDTDMDALSEQFPSLAGLFIFPTMRLEMLLELAMAGHTMPAGITRFLIPGRILRLNAPLDRLADAGSLVEKRQWLEHLVHDRMVQRQVRHYEEPVVLLDE